MEDTIRFDSGCRVKMGVVAILRRGTHKWDAIRRCFVADGGGMTTSTYAGIAQLVERWLCNPQVVGSSPTVSSKLDSQLSSGLLVRRVRHLLDRVAVPNGYDKAIYLDVAQLDRATAS